MRKRLMPLFPPHLVKESRTQTSSDILLINSKRCSCKYIIWSSTMQRTNQRVTKPNNMAIIPSVACQIFPLYSSIPRNSLHSHLRKENTRKTTPICSLENHQNHEKPRKTTKKHQKELFYKGLGPRFERGASCKSVSQSKNHTTRLIGS